MTFLKRHVINAFTFARTGHTETDADCIIWHNVVDCPSYEERMVLNEDGSFNRLERRNVGETSWWLAKLQGNPAFHNALLDAVKRLGWKIDEVWLQPMAMRGTPEYAEEA